MTRSNTSSIALCFGLVALLLASSGSVAQAKRPRFGGSMFTRPQQTSSNDRYQRTRSVIVAHQQAQAERRGRVNRSVMGIIAAQTAANRQQSQAEQHRRVRLSSSHDPHGVLKLAPQRNPNGILKLAPRPDSRGILTLVPQRDPNGILTLVPERDPNGILTLAPERDPNDILKLAPRPDPMGTLKLKSPSSDRSKSDVVADLINSTQSESSSDEVLRRIKEAHSSGETQQPERRTGADNTGEHGVLQLQEND